MSNIPKHLKYTKSHEWVETQKDGTVKVGITDHAQDLLGDVVYVELPRPGRLTKTGEACAVVESVKAASDIYSPIAGEVVEANGALSDQPELVNKDAYGSAWMLRLKPANPAELDSLLDARGYESFIASEAH
ncbi:MAG: glycine cleavage system protein GcvH [Gammaproteobacteria bacterium]|nr:MAG: glycine cleavage system protein GcvH [Gammaproteobacteria bacterium]